jgi:HAE1 family hydrophobic/amphiphilic exporter-1
MIKKFNTHPKAIISILAALILFSIIFFKKINLELFPPYTYPAVTIECSCPGEIAEVIEKKITIPLEQVFNSIDGIENISSTSEENKCEIILEFAYGSDINIKIQEIKEKIRYVKQKLPDSIQKLRILKYSSQSDPAIIIALTSNNLNLHQLRYEIEKNIKKEFLLIKNIANVEIFGGKEEKILVDIEQQKLFSYNLNVYNINKSLATGNVYNPLGQITHDGLEFNLQALSSYKNIKQIKNTAVFNGNKSSVFIRNVGNIKKGYLKEQVITKINGKKTVALYIYTRTGSNILNISKKVIKKIKSLDKKNKNFTFTIVYNQAKFISKAINELLNSGK